MVLRSAPELARFALSVREDCGACHHSSASSSYQSDFTLPWASFYDADQIRMQQSRMHRQLMAWERPLAHLTARRLFKKRNASQLPVQPGVATSFVDLPRAGFSAEVSACSMFSSRRASSAVFCRSLGQLESTIKAPNSINDWVKQTGSPTYHPSCLQIGAARLIQFRGKVRVCTTRRRSRSTDSWVDDVVAVLALSGSVDSFR